MNLKKAAKEFGQQKLELKEKEDAILAELEKILFSCPFDYSKETITEIGCKEEAYYIYPCIQLPPEYATYNTEYTIENNVIFKTYIVTTRDSEVKFYVTEISELIPKKFDYKTADIDCTIETFVLSKIDYIIKIENSTFKLSKKIPEIALCNQYDEVITPKMLRTSAEEIITAKNNSILRDYDLFIGNFIHIDERENLLGKLFANYLKNHQDQGIISFPINNYLKGMVRISESKKKCNIQLEFNCNKTKVVFHTNFLHLEYHGVVTLQTTNRAFSVSKISDSGYGIIPEIIKDNISVSKLLLKAKFSN